MTDPMAILVRQTRIRTRHDPNYLRARISLRECVLPLGSSGQCNDEQCRSQLPVTFVNASSRPVSIIPAIYAENVPNLYRLTNRVFLEPHGEDLTKRSADRRQGSKHVPVNAKLVQLLINQSKAPAGYGDDWDL